LQLSSPRDLLNWAYAHPDWSHIAALAPLVVECAAQGDAVADTILKHGVGELFRSAPLPPCHRRQPGRQAPPLAVACARPPQSLLGLAAPGGQLPAATPATALPPAHRSIKAVVDKLQLARNGQAFKVGAGDPALVVPCCLRLLVAN
jgi:hypothetical protein